VLLREVVGVEGVEVDFVAVYGGAFTSTMPEPERMELSLVGPSKISSVLGIKKPPLN
jgi:hypothetical protein